MEYWNKIKRTAKNILRPLVYKRKIQGYCIGLPKSGTHSIAAIFKKNYRSKHEPDKYELQKKIINIYKNKLLCDEFKKYVREREKKLCLDFNSSYLNVYIADVLVKEFPQAKFLLTIRDCYSWMDSAYNQLLSGNFEKYQNKNFIDFIKCLLKIDNYEYKNEERVVLEKANVLLDHRLPSTECLLNFWTSINKAMIDTIPNQRLLIVKTNEIDKNLEKISNFFSIPRESLDVTKTHMFKAHKKFNILSELPREFIEMQVKKYCKELMYEFFPGTKYNAQRVKN